MSSVFVVCVCACACVCVCVCFACDNIYILSFKKKFPTQWVLFYIYPFLPKKTLDGQVIRYFP